jgi:hypothetical protein
MKEPLLISHSPDWVEMYTGNRKNHTPALLVSPRAPSDT